MRRGLPTDGSSAREIRMRKSAPAARSKSPGASPAPWWHQTLLWALLLASLPLVNLKAPPEPENIGVTMMLSPFVLAADAGVSVARSRGSQRPEGGSSWPRTWARAFGTAVYAFFGLWLSYRLALRFAGSAAALLATVAIWLASSLPVYLYALPSESLPAAMFLAALVLTIWLSVRGGGSARWRWLVFGLAGGLATVASPFCAALLVVGFIESVAQMARPRGFVPALINGLVFLVGVAAIIGPAVLLTSQTVPLFRWATPGIWAETFSTTHGAFVWTPILLLAVFGLTVALRRQPARGLVLIVAGALFVYLVAATEYPGTDEVAYGNRYLVPLVPIFVCGLAALIDALVGHRSRLAWTSAISVAALMILWNLGLMLQWGTGIIPNDRPLDIRRAAANQLSVVPHAAKEFVVRYTNDRNGPMGNVEGGAR